MMAYRMARFQAYTDGLLRLAAYDPRNRRVFVRRFSVQLGASNKDDLLGSELESDININSKFFKK
jgi:hypothetical protein